MRCVSRPRPQVRMRRLPLWARGKCGAASSAVRRRVDQPCILRSRTLGRRAVVPGVEAGVPPGGGPAHYREGWRLEKNIAYFVC